MINRLDGLRILRALQRGLSSGAPPSPQRLRGEGLPVTHLYPPERRPKTGALPLVLLPGIAKLGAEDPRVVALARAVARLGYTILVPDLQELRVLALPANSVQLVAGALSAVRKAAGGRVGVIGFCYGATTALAARDPGVVAYLLVGPVVNLREVLLRPRDPYVTEIVENSREGGRLSKEEVVARAEAEIDPIGSARSTRASVFVLHGAGDTIERPEEGERLARAAPLGHFLKTPLVGHANLSKARLRDAWRMAHFLAHFLHVCSVQAPAAASEASETAGGSTVFAAAEPGVAAGGPSGGGRGGGAGGGTGEGGRPRLFGRWRRARAAESGASSETRRLVLDHLQAVGRHDSTGMAAGLSLDAVYDVPAAGLLLGRAGWLDLHRQIWSGVPDFELEVGQVIEGEGRLAVELGLRGTNQGGFLGVPGNGRRFDVRAVALFQVRDGRIARESVYYDHATVLRQLGATVAGSSPDPAAGAPVPPPTASSPSPA
ncbi:MAG: ester cyclase [Planctomycetes bacterium]|nr:ester cyclase [Planctomycetota bacterium]